MTATLAGPNAPVVPSTATVDVEQRAGAGTATAVVRGTVDVTNVYAVRRALLDVAVSGLSELHVDLSAADLIDPTAAAALVHLAGVCREHAVELSLVVLSGSVTASTLDNCGLGRAFAHQRRCP